MSKITLINKIKTMKKTKNPIIRNRSMKKVGNSRVIDRKENSGENRRKNHKNKAEVLHFRKVIKATRKVGVEVKADTNKRKRLNILQKHIVAVKDANKMTKEVKLVFV